VRRYVPHFYSSTLLSLSLWPHLFSLLPSAAAGEPEDLDLRRRALGSTASASGVVWPPARPWLHYHIQTVKRSTGSGLSTRAVDHAPIHFLGGSIHAQQGNETRGPEPVLLQGWV
jgi:hypothetical protein